MNWFEKEEDELTRQVNAGEISNKEYQDAMRDLRDILQQEARDRAQEAYDREMNRW